MKQDYYFKDGCTECGGNIIFYEDSFTYKCEDCGVFASAHRKDTENSKMYEPYQYLADANINTLRTSLEDVFNIIWQTRVKYKRSLGDTYQEAIINIVYPHNIRNMPGPEDQFVKVINANYMKGQCDVYVYNTGKVLEGIDYKELAPVKNRNKAFIWLAEELGIKQTECRIGMLSEAQLKAAIEICSKNLSDARKKAIESYSG